MLRIAPEPPLRRADWLHDCKHISDRTCSCPRDWRFSASWSAQLKDLLKPFVHHSTIVLRGLRDALYWSPIMPRDASLSHRQCKLFQPGGYVRPDRAIICSLYWHKLMTVNYITKLIMFSHNRPVTRNYITPINNFMLTGFERLKHVCNLRWISI